LRLPEDAAERVGDIGERIQTAIARSVVGEFSEL